MVADLNKHARDLPFNNYGKPALKEKDLISSELLLQLKLVIVSGYVYLAHPDYLEQLCKELGEVSQVHGNLVFSPKKMQAAFAQDIWYEPVICKIESINDAAKILREQNAIWFANIVNCARRTTLIAEKLRLFRSKELNFPIAKPPEKVAAFSLLDQNTLIYSVKRWKAMPNGEYHFIEDKITPPNRAYLKLWEALSILNQYPQPSELTIDLGASPGGWTYVLQSFGAQVIAVDKALLDAKIAALPNITMRQESAFALSPNDFEKVDWLVCDVACYPERLYTFLEKWITSGKVRHIIATIKLQGETDFASVQKFQAIPGGEVVHLFYNKHELTFIWCLS